MFVFLIGYFAWSFCVCKYVVLLGVLLVVLRGMLILV